MSLSKSLKKRVRITNNGKIVRRPTGVNHFRTRKDARKIQGKRKTLSLNYPIKKIINY
jgi:ribosomal protein L35